ncbi:hypothetical protein LT708_25215 [Pseudomonas syringae pv. syringae]|uniref:hypothetical protein n=1 Tax=Pseudomonas syringae TaxID=317 RepID=UPI00200AB51D|nr:hypothetical protein [Pseudomonas syringae]MCK9759895.1 hypothetical protein [Pseudomonas syringae pv. syringae]MCK9774886.1 hypothetical protein [Pseudomonas syringae pv. syringae]
MNQIHAKQPVQNLLNDFDFDVLSHVPSYMRKGIPLSHIVAKQPVQNLLIDLDFEVVSKVPAYVRRGIEVSRGPTSILVGKDICKPQNLDKAA